MKNQTKKSTVRTILFHLKPYSFLLFLSLLLSAFSVALMLYEPVIVGETVDLMLGVNAVDFACVSHLLLRLLIAILLSALFQWIASVINQRIAYHVVRDVRNEAFRRLEVLPLSYLDTHASGGIVSRVITDAEQFADGLLLGFSQLFTGALTIIGTLLFMLFIRPSITFVVVLLTPLSFVVASVVAKRTYAMFRRQAELRAEQTALIDELIVGQKTLKAFSRERDNLSRFDDTNERLEKCSRRAIFYSSLTNPGTRFVNSIVYAVVALVGAYICIKTAGTEGALSVGALASFLAYANRYTKPFNEISGVVAELQNALACAARVFDVTNEPRELPDAENALDMQTALGAVDLSHVRFSYVPERPLLRDVSLSVLQGKRVAIVGPTGCGKTTLINLLMRFYDVCDGAISVDKTDIRQITRRSLRAQYGMVLQDTWLFAGTVKENIAMGNPDATDEEIERAARKAHAHSFIMCLPKGYDTYLPEDGGSLSAGQRQLLCIARVMLCLPPMLILDEATSSIDTRTEMKIQEAFADMMRGRTTFIVAHRLSTIREADIILVMRDGDIVEKGTHEALLAKDGFYARLYRSQFEGNR